MLVQKSYYLSGPDWQQSLLPVRKYLGILWLVAAHAHCSQYMRIVDNYGCSACLKPVIILLQPSLIQYYSASWVGQGSVVRYRPAIAKGRHSEGPPQRSSAIAKVRHSYGQGQGQGQGYGYGQGQASYGGPSLWRTFAMADRNPVVRVSASFIF